MIEKIINDLKNQDLLESDGVLSSFSNSGLNTSQLNSSFISKMPKDLIEFWNIHESAILFEDIKYGQWGLRILPPRKAENITKEMGGASDVRLALLLLAQDKKRRKSYKSNDIKGFSSSLIRFEIDYVFYPSITFDTPPDYYLLKAI